MINKDSVIVMDKICRSCMTEGAEMRSMFEEMDASGTAMQLADMLMACASVQVSSGDGLPALMCTKCERQLNSAYTFKQQCERTDAMLREYTNQSVDQSEPAVDEPLDIKPVIKSDIDTINEYYNNADYSPAGRESDHSYSPSEKPKKTKRPRRSSRTSSRLQCKVCNKIVISKHVLKIHEIKHSGGTIKTCYLCQASFDSSSHLVRHMKTHVNDERKHVCQECGETFKRAYHLAKHKKDHRQVKMEKALTEENSESPGDEAANNDRLEEGEIPNETETPYQCKFCDKALNTEVGLQIHMRRHTGDKLASCQVCSKSFTKTNHLKRHLRTHGIQPPPDYSPREKPNSKEKRYLECEFCDRKFVYRKSFRHHVQTEHGIFEDSDEPSQMYLKETDVSVEPVNETGNTNGDNIEDSKPPNFVTIGDASTEDAFGKTELNEMGEAAKVHACHVCNQKFNRANHLTRHMTLHRAVLTHKCDKCEKAFVSEEHLKKHSEQYHIARPYVCIVCNKHFGRGEHLIRHLRQHDKDDSSSPHKCCICDKAFTRSDHLARHMKLHLAQDKRHVCTDCGKAFNRLDNLRTHMRVHTGTKEPQRLHLCVYCGKEFNNSSNMIVHMRRHTGERPYKCGQCGKGFPRSHDLKCHERVHSGEKPYLCTLCGKSFNKSNKLLRHTRVHTGERPYVCNLCGRAFTQSNDLALHMRRHTGSRPYACGMCPARFIQSGQLKAHRRSQGHWLETPPELKGAYRVSPVTPVTNPTPIKFKPRVTKIKQDILLELGQTVGITAEPTVSIAEGSFEPQYADDLLESKSDNDIKIQAVQGFAVVESEDHKVTIGAFQESVDTDGSFAGVITTTASTFTETETFTYPSFG